MLSRATNSAICSRVKPAAWAETDESEPADIGLAVAANGAARTPSLRTFRRREQAAPLIIADRFHPYGGGMGQSRDRQHLLLFIPFHMVRNAISEMQQ